MPDPAVGATRLLAEFVATLDVDALPAEVVDAYQSLLLDTLACALAASGTELADQLGAVADGMGAGPCTLVGRSGGASPMAAALYNGALSHSLNYSALGPGNAHLGAVLLGGILAAAQHEGAVSGRRLLVALVAAGETVTRLAEAVAASPQGRTVRQRWLLGQLLGYAGVAAGCAKLLDLDVARTHSALGVALMQASGSMEVMRLGDVPAKAAYAAFPNLAGLTAALLARAGVGADYHAVEGDLGLFPLFLGIDPPGPRWADDLGSRFHSASAHVKRWPVSVNVERFVAALAAAPPVPAPALVGVEVTTVEDDRPWLEPVQSRRRPANAAAAANSIPFSLATFLVHGDIPVGRAADALADDAEVARLADRVTHRIAPDQGRSLVLTHADGRRTRLVVPDLGASGPVPRAVVADKLRRCAALAGTRVPERVLARIEAQVGDLAGVPDVGALVALTEGVAGPGRAEPRPDRRQEVGQP
jgi:2-methylcitrate dehydratase PrpD